MPLVIDTYWTPHFFHCIEEHYHDDGARQRENMLLLEKVVTYENLEAWRAGLLTPAKPIVVTNGCFDLLHPGHVHLLKNARSMGKTLLVGVNCDAAVRHLKGPSRPTLSEKDRLMMLCGLESVSNVCLFPGIEAVDFLKKSQPDIYVKGGDYTPDTLNQNERRFLEVAGIRVEFVPKFESQSTSAIVQRILRQAQKPDAL